MRLKNFFLLENVWIDFCKCQHCKSFSISVVILSIFEVFLVIHFSMNIWNYSKKKFVSNKLHTFSLSWHLCVKITMWFQQNMEKIDFLTQKNFQSTENALIPIAPLSQIKLTLSQPNNFQENFPANVISQSELNKSKKKILLLIVTVT